MVSLRQKLIDAGITDEPTIRSHLKHAHDVIRYVPGVDLKRFNPLKPMDGIHEG